MRARLASKNEHKLGELRKALPGWELQLVAVEQYPEETGATYEENARLKARYGRLYAPPDEWVIGEDSGIEADALGGEPGVRSARWSPASSQSQALVERLEGETNRRARMVTAIVALSPEGEEVVAAGALHGRVALEKRGSHGFGYDPVFVPDGEERTVAELGDEWKSEHSHRARAAKALMQALELRPGAPRSGHG